jgi:hypothetical protein
MDAVEPHLRVDPGLCGSCRNALLRPTNRGTVYLRCTLSATDSRFPRYPPLPVRACSGYLPGESVTEDPATQ